MRSNVFGDNWRALACAVALSLAGCVNTPPLPPATIYDRVDKFQAELAGRVSKKIDPYAKAKDLQVVVTQIAPPIGTIYRAGTSIPVNEKACKPKPEPSLVTAPGLFPGAYRVSKSLAIDLGLDDAVFQGLASLGGNVSDSDSIGLSIQDTTWQVLNDDSTRALTVQPDCRLALEEERNGWLVRGYISGIRNLSVQRRAGASGEASVTKIGHFKIHSVDQWTIVLRDEGAQKFLQVVSEVSVSPKETAVGTIAVPSKSKLSGKEGVVHIITDRSDLPAAGDQFAKHLRRRFFSFRISLKSLDQMPEVSQVHYFDEDDKAEAQEVLKILKEQRPDGRLIRSGLPAKRGQLEVYLTKRGTGGGGF